MSKKAILYTAIGIPSAIIWFYLFWIPLKTDFLEVKSLKLRHFNPWHVQPEPPYLISPDTLAEFVVEAEYVDVDIPEETTLNEVDKPYHLIVGSFMYMDNALRLKEQLWSNGYQPEILETTIGFNRVSISSFETYSEALTVWRETRASTYNDAWLLKVQPQ